MPGFAPTRSWGDFRSSAAQTKVRAGRRALTGFELLQTRVEGSVLVAEVRLSVNLVSATIQQVVARRHSLLSNMNERMQLDAPCASCHSSAAHVSLQ